MSRVRALALAAGLAALPTCGGETTHFPPTVVTSVRDAVSVSVSNGSTCVVHSDATIDCWGQVDFVDIPEGPSPRRVGRTGVRQISLSLGTGCLRDDAGGVWCWALGHEASPEQVRGLSDVALISNPAIAIENSGDVFYYCVPGGCSESPQLVPWAQGASLATGWCAALLTSTFPSGGHLQCKSPLGAPESWFADRTVLALESTPANAYALLDDGSVFCSGNSTEYQCGHLGASDFSPVPGIPPAVDIFAGGSSACAKVRDGAVWCWGGPLALPVDGASSTGCGGNKLPLPCVAPLEVPALRGAKQVALAEDHGCAIMADGSLKCWGDNTYGQLGQ